ncbi:CamS family sex pheromone protein [Levilactobacillus suantsaiihabitans]|uniref:CamS family sex pheromone protein n=1 Tax=Levilactobacillus suantsaiihabitans TaxID=2487722 RepID=A0A4Z0J980_9LACO|nr:CamS family sex pheromone protein [Levilactobacillus suantsaiihabitans]TGD18574.1 CamS family sex pheromone protein [Levilactobacillus suantsaiihabitans]
MKRLRTFLALAAVPLFLAACGNLGSSSMSGTSGSNSSGSTQLTGQSSDGDYEGVIKSGHYQTSKSRGVTNSQDSGNTYNLKSFENGMLSVSKKVFSTKKYVFQEGQHLTTSTVQNWLDRKSKSNPTGLNPKSNGSTSSTKRNPIYIQALEEQDYMTQKNNKLHLGGVTVGIAVNSVDYYKKTQYGATYETKITKAAGEAYAKQAANTVLKRLRQKSALKDVPIVIAIYRQASNDSLVGGDFIAYSQNKAGSTSVAKWTAMDEKNYVFPISSGSSSPNSNDSSAFTNFKTEVENFFPNLSGVTAQAHYNGKSLTGMHVNIQTQFYSQTEIISFTQYLQTAAQKYLPSGVPIDITVASTDGTQSFLSRASGAKKFTSHVFNSY